MVSSCGLIKSLDKWIPCNANGGIRLRKGRILKQTPQVGGYLLVSLSKENKTKKGYVHRLVAEAFIPNPDNLPEINHIDGNKENNHVSNLEWCTASHNKKHAYDMGLRKVSEKTIEAMRKAGRESRKPVRCVETGEVFKSITVAADSINLSVGAISAVLKGRNKTAGDFHWEYVE